VSAVKYELGSYIPENDILHSHHHENLRSHILGISLVAVQSILKDCLNVHWAATKYVSNLLSKEKSISYSMFQDLQGKLGEETQNPF
jgi:hypothetical protein